MAEHDIYFEIPSGTLKNKDAIFEIYSDNEKLGNLKVSKGSIEWVPANHTNGYHLAWETFGELMEKNGGK